MTRYLIAIAAAIAFFSAPAFAVPVVWTVSGVTFDDGGTASGQFTFDPDTKTFGHFSISVAGGNLGNFPAITYAQTNASAFEDNLSNPQDSVLFELNDGSQRTLRMTPVSALSNSGGTVALNLNTSGGNSGGVECFNCGPARTITAGSLVGVPPPPLSSVRNAPMLSTWATILLGLTVAAVGLLAGRRKARAVAPRRG